MNLRDVPLLEERIGQALVRLDLEAAEAEARRYLDEAGELPAGGTAPAPRLRAFWLAARVALAAGRLALALERARPLLAEAERLPPRLACGLWLLIAEACWRLGDRDGVRNALARLEATDFALLWRTQAPLRLQRLRVLLGLDGVRGLTGEVTACRRLLATDPENLALLGCEEGLAWDAAGEPDEAERCWRNALAILPAADPHPVRADALAHLGRLAHLRGHLQAALDRYEDARTAAPSSTPQALTVRLRRLLVWLELNRHERARTDFAELLGDQAVDELPEEVRGLAVTVAALLDLPGFAGGTEVEAYRAARRGDRDLARELYRRALAHATGPVRVARLSLALGLLEQAGDGTGAAETLGRAEALAREHDLPEVLWRSLEAQGCRAAEQEADDSGARRLLEEAVLVSEEQARRLGAAADAAVYRLHRAGLLRLLLRGACRRRDAAAVFRYQELERGRLLFELYRDAGHRPTLAPSEDSGPLGTVDRDLALCERLLALHVPGPSQRQALERRHAELCLRRDRLLEEWLADRSRRGDSSLPPLPERTELERCLSPNTIYVAPCLVEDELYLLRARRGEPACVERVPGSAAALHEHLRQLRDGIQEALVAYDQNRWGPVERARLEEPLRRLGEGPLGEALFGLLRDGERLLWVPDDALHGLPVAALRRRGEYLVERAEVVHAFSGALFVHQRTSPPPSRWGRPSLVVMEDATELPYAGVEGAGVAAALARAHCRGGAAAGREAVRPFLAQARVVHFACHAYFDAAHSLNACLHLPSGERWRLLEWLDEPVAGLPLLTLSACRSAEVGPLVGREVYGLVTGALAAGVRAVVAGLWSVPDREAAGFMWRFYRHRLTADLATALARAQRETLRDPDGSPLFWAVFALFGDATALPAPGLLGHCWGRWRQWWHRRRFPSAGPPAWGDRPVESSDVPQEAPAR